MAGRGDKQAWVPLLMALVTGIGVLAQGSCGPRGFRGSQQQAGRAAGTADSALGCGDATRSLEARYQALRECDSDSECNYIDGFYDILPRSETAKPVTVAACGEPTPFLVAANGLKVQQTLDSLLAEQRIQRDACSDRRAAPSCERPLVRFEPRTPPSCVRGKCVSTVLPG